MNQTITIPGQPVAQSRPRFSIRGGRAHVYDGDKSRDYKLHVLLTATRQGAELMTGPVSVEILFLMQRPKSLPKKVKHHVKKPDIDNLTKAILDGLNGVLWKDDSQVCELVARKIYTRDEPGVVLTVSEYDAEPVGVIAGYLEGGEDE